MRLNRKTIAAALGIVAAVLVRLYCIHFHPHILGDAMVYGDLARNMLQHHTFAITEPNRIRPTLIRLPGYPLLMAACFAVFGIGNYYSVVYVQLILDVASCCFVASLAARLFGKRAGLIALWLAALCPFTADYVATGYTEIVSVFCVTLAFFSLERWHADLRHGRRWSNYLWPLAFALSFGCLLRPDRTLLAAAVVAAMIWLAWHTSARPRALTQIAIVCLIIALPLAAWAVRNSRVFHVIQPLAPKYANDPGDIVNYGFNRWYRTWAIEFESTFDIYWTWDGSVMNFGDLPSRAYDLPGERDRTAAIFAEYNRETSATPDVDSAFAALAAERVRAHPFQYYVELPVARLVNMWLRPRTEMDDVPLDWWRFNDDRLGCIEAATLGFVNLAYLALAAFGLWCWRKQAWLGQRVLAFSMIGFVLLRSALLLTVDNSEPRYTLDCYPIVILLAAFAFPFSSRLIKAGAGVKEA
jgi:4-amino-4-deoxy-L-arabinose transferase-like glycosyltransferase